MPGSNHPKIWIPSPEQHGQPVFLGSVSVNDPQFGIISAQAVQRSQIRQVVSQRNPFHQIERENFRTLHLSRLLQHHVNRFPFLNAPTADEDPMTSLDRPPGQAENMPGFSGHGAAACDLKDGKRH